MARVRGNETLLLCVIISVMRVCVCVCVKAPFDLVSSVIGKSGNNALTWIGNAVGGTTFTTMCSRMIHSYPGHVEHEEQFIQRQRCCRGERE